MPEMQIRVENTQSTRERAAVALGLDEPSLFDVVNRADYKDENAYIDALVTERMRRDTPEYKAARRKLVSEAMEREEKERQKANAAAYKEIRAKIELDEIQQKWVDADAADRAKRDLSAGRISASQLGDRIAEYGKALTEKAKDKKAADVQFNQMIRGMYFGK